MSGKLRYEVDRGLDVAISEYAPGRSIVVDKQTYQIGGLFSPGSDRVYGQATTPARAYMDDANYLKPILTCPECGWFGLADERPDVCPFCGNRALEEGRQMLRPWGFAPKMQKQFRMLSWTRNIHRFSLRFILRFQMRRTFKQFPVAKTSEWHLARINELLW